MASHPGDRKTLDAMEARGGDLSKPTEVNDLARVGFEALAQRFDGEFDGWAAAIEE